MNTSRYILVFVITIMVIITSSTPATLVESFSELETEVHSRMSEIDSDVFADFKKKYKCQDCDDKTFDMLLHEFEAFKRNWINDMVNFIIK